MANDVNPPPPSSRARVPRDPLFLALVYAVFAALWILLSDQAAAWLFDDPLHLALASTVKGWLFVAVTALLLYLLLRRRGDGTAGGGGALEPARVLSWPVLAIVLLIVGVTAAGIAHSVAKNRQAEEARLHAIADLKVRQIGDWLDERLRDARYIQSNAEFVAQYASWRGRGDETAGRHLTARLEQLRDYRGFAAITLLDPAGKPLWATRQAPARLAPELLAAVERGRDGQIRRVGPYLGVAGTPRLDFLVPLPAPEGPPPLLVLHVDPKAWLYPMLQTWPVPSASGETQLFRRNGDQVQFLNDLRHRPASAVSFQLPLANAGLLAAQVLSGRGEVVETLAGVDYRGVPVLGMARGIPGTDWYLLAKLDRDEVYAGALDDAAWIGLAGVLSLFIIFASLVMLRQRQRLALAEHARLAELERMRALKLLEAFAESSEDAIFAKDPEGRYILFNRAASLFVGKPVEEVLGRDDRALFPAEQAARLMALDRRAIADNRILTEEEVLDTPHGTRVFLATKGPLRDARDQVIGSFGVSRDITDSRLAEDRLADQMRRFHLLLDSSRDGIVILDQDHQVVEANRRFAEMLGYAPEEVLTLHTWDFDALRSEADIRAGFAELGHARLLFESRHRRKDGGEYDVEISASGAVWGGRSLVLCICRDITERKAAEAALRASEQRFHDIVNASADWVWEVDARVRFTYASEGIRDMLGHAPQEVLGKTPFDLMPEPEAQRVRAEFEAIAARKLPFRDLENINLHQDGSLRYVLTNGTPILDGAGNVLGYRGVDRDVTEQKLAEIAVKESEVRWIMAMDSAGHGVWDWNTATHRVYYSPAWKAMLGHADAEIGDRLEEWSERVHPEDLPRYQSELERHFHGETDTYVCELRMRCKDGGYKWILDRGRVVDWDSQGKPARVIGTHTDISLVKAAEEDLRRQSAELADRNAELERFNRASVGRELDMIELKKTVNALARELGREPPYDLSFAADTGGKPKP